MLVTAINDKAALIVVDFQKNIVNSLSIHPISSVIERYSALIDAFRQHGLQVGLVNVVGVLPGAPSSHDVMRRCPRDFTDLNPELNRQPGDIVVTKQTWGAFPSADLETS
jgi:nicotinamidase-related amidase